MFKVDNSRSDVFIINFEHISHVFLVFLLLTLSKSTLVGLLNQFENSSLFSRITLLFERSLLGNRIFLTFEQMYSITIKMCFSFGKFTVLS